MITINDDQRLLNLNHMAIYLMLTQDEKNQYGEKLRPLANDRAITRGLFQLEIVEKVDAPYEMLPQRMKKMTTLCNVMVRLVNDIHGIYSYGMNYVDLDASADEIADVLKDIVDEICDEDIKRLGVLKYRHSTCSKRAMEEYREKQFVKEVLEVAKDGGDVEAAKAEAAYGSLLNATDSLDFKESLEMICSAFDAKAARIVKMQYYEITKPVKKPEICVTLTDVDTGRKPKKDGSIKKGMGFDISINGEHLPVYFGTTDQKLLYTALCLARLEERVLTRRYFQINATPKNKIWLKNIYKSLDMSGDFSDWFAAMQGGNAHRIDDAVSKVKGGLFDILESHGMTDAYYYLSIITKDARTDNTHYEIRLAKNHIKLDPNLEQRLGGN